MSVLFLALPVETVAELGDTHYTIHPMFPDDLGGVLEVYRQGEYYLGLGPVATASMEMALVDTKLSYLRRRPTWNS